MSRWKVRLVFALTVTSVAVFLGYRRGYAQGGEQAEAPGQSGSAPAVRTADAPREHPQREKPHLKGPAALAAMREELGGAHFSPVYRARGWALVRDFTAEQVQTALAELAGAPQGDVAQLQRELLLYRWAQMDPQAAGAAALAGPEERRAKSLGPVLCAWMRHDPEAALAWADAEETPLAHQEALRQVTRLWADPATTDPAVALKKMMALGGGAPNVYLSQLSEEMARTAAGREKFLALTADLPQEQRTFARGTMASSWAVLDAPGALAAIDGSAAADDEKRTARDAALNIWRSRDPGAALDWMMQPQSQIPAKRRVESYAKWVLQAPEAAVTWLGNTGDASFIGQAVRQSALAMYPDTQIMDLTQPSRATLAMKNQFALWQQAQPDAAAAWRDGLPSLLKNLLTPSADAPSR